MIKIKRKDCPSFLQKGDNEFGPKDYSNDDVKKALLDMQHGKCCYCERKISDLPPKEREVDHYIPQGSRIFKDDSNNTQWHLVNRWENLLYSCGKCNSAKSMKMPSSEEASEILIINPTCDDLDPEDHIGFGFTIDENPFFEYIEQNDSEIGRSTIKKLGFHERTDLFNSLRTTAGELSKALMGLINAIESNLSEDISEKEKYLLLFTSAHKPFAAFSRAFLRSSLEKLLNKPSIGAIHKEVYNRILSKLPKGHEVLN